MTFLTDTGSVKMVKVTTKACFTLYQCASSVYERKLSAYSADVCKLASLGPICGCNPLIHTAEAKPTLPWSEVFIYGCDV